MKRRKFVQTILGVSTAAVYGATGWLMGTRTLTMPGNGTWGPWTDADDCTSYGTNCGCFQQYGYAEYCDNWSPCETSVKCYRWDAQNAYCCVANFENAPLCAFKFRNWPCGSCVSTVGYAGGTCN